MFSYFLRFHISVLEIYISNLGARPVLVHFWEYIFRNWITVQGEHPKFGLHPGINQTNHTGQRNVPHMAQFENIICLEMLDIRVCAYF
jgi:hypothetical protein